MLTCARGGVPDLCQLGLEKRCDGNDATIESHALAHWRRMDHVIRHVQEEVKWRTGSGEGTAKE